jgi:hypothetical protein
MTTTPRDGSCARPSSKFWIADASYTARCPDGRSVTVSRQGRSEISLEHARTVAVCLAKNEAIRQAACFCATVPCQPVNGAYPWFNCGPLPNGPNYRFKEDKTFQLFDPVTFKFCTPTIYTDPDSGAVMIQLGDPED